MAQLTSDDVVELVADLRALGVTRFKWGDLEVEVAQTPLAPVVVNPPKEADPPWVREAEEEARQAAQFDVREIARRQGIGPLGFPAAKADR